MNTEKRLSLNLTVRGSNDIEFDNKDKMGIDLEEGMKTGDMTEFGLGINTAWCTDMDQRLGGCLDREQTLELRDYLNKVIDLWNPDSLPL